jgi:hypothetical protein
MANTKKRVRHVNTSDAELNVQFRGNEKQPAASTAGLRL